MLGCAEHPTQGQTRAARGNGSATDDEDDAGEDGNDDEDFDEHDALLSFEAYGAPMRRVFGAGVVVVTGVLLAAIVLAANQGMNADGWAVAFWAVVDVALATVWLVRYRARGISASDE